MRARTSHEVRARFGYGTMSYGLRTGLSFCTIDGIALFLDVDGDRYFRLPGKLNTAFLQLAANGSLEEPTLKALERAGVIAGGGAPAPIRPFVHPVPGARHRATAQGPFRLADVARAIASQRRVERRLSKGSLRSVLGEFSRLSNACSTSELAEGGGAARAVRAFELARLLRSPANRCLPRSIALANCLASHGVTAQVVLAVKLAPFAAHCWTQLGDTVLNDTPEEVARYTPILVV